MALQTAPAAAMSHAPRLARALALGGLGLALAACGSLGDDAFGNPFKSSENRQRQADIAASNVTAIGVNSYLWRASLETLSFMPLAQADSSGGVIVTDWYSHPQNPNERVKLSVSILDQDLRTRCGSPPRAKCCRAGPGFRHRSRRQPCSGSRTSS